MGNFHVRKFSYEDIFRNSEYSQTSLSDRRAITTGLDGTISYQIQYDEVSIERPFFLDRYSDLSHFTTD